MICGKNVQILDPIDKCDFERKRCFEDGFSCVKIDNQNIEKPVKNSFKNVLTAETGTVANRRIKNNQTEKNEDEYDDGINPFEVESLVLPPPPERGQRFRVKPEDVYVEFKLNKYLRDHQRVGIVFMYKCIVGFHPGVFGCLVADEMGKNRVH